MRRTPHLPPTHWPLALALVTLAALVTACTSAAPVASMAHEAAISATASHVTTQATSHAAHRPMGESASAGQQSKDSTTNTASAKFNATAKSTLNALAYNTATASDSMAAYPSDSPGKAGTPGPQPTLPGQDAFGALQEIVAILEADPETDWSRVNLGELRQHLIDMTELMLNAEAREKPLANGLEIEITGYGRTLRAIQAMVPAHAEMLNGLRDWRARSDEIQNGRRLVIISTDPREVAHIQGLGFAGLMVSGGHHQAHHLAMARGERVQGAQ